MGPKKGTLANFAPYEKVSTKWGNRGIFTVKDAVHFFKDAQYAAREGQLGASHVTRCFELYSRALPKKYQGLFRICMRGNLFPILEYHPRRLLSVFEAIKKTFPVEAPFAQYGPDRLVSHTNQKGAEVDYKTHQVLVDHLTDVFSTHVSQHIIDHETLVNFYTEVRAGFDYQKEQTAAETRFKALRTARKIADKLGRRKEASEATQEAPGVPDIAMVPCTALGAPSPDSIRSEQGNQPAIDEARGESLTPLVPPIEDNEDARSYTDELVPQEEEEEPWLRMSRERTERPVQANVTLPSSDLVSSSPNSDSSKLDAKNLLEEDDCHLHYVCMRSISGPDGEKQHRILGLSCPGKVPCSTPLNEAPPGVVSLRVNPLPFGFRESPSTFGTSHLDDEWELGSVSSVASASTVTKSATPTEFGSPPPLELVLPTIATLEPDVQVSEDVPPPEERGLALEPAGLRLWPWEETREFVNPALSDLERVQTIVDGEEESRLQHDRILELSLKIYELTGLICAMDLNGRFIHPWAGENDYISSIMRQITIHRQLPNYTIRDRILNLETQLLKLEMYAEVAESDNRRTGNTQVTLFPPSVYRLEGNLTVVGQD